MSLPVTSGHRSVLLCLLIPLAFLSCTTEPFEEEYLSTFPIDSSITDASYDIKVALPEDYSSDKSYETIYLLDSNWYFDHTAREVAEISKSNSKENVILIGIGEGNDRMKDYVPTTTSEGEGGAPDFIEFLNEELIPRVEEEYSVVTGREGRTILGHSAGGLFAAYSFTRHNETFANYLMLSPAIWYDEGIILTYEEEERENLQSQEQTVFVGLAELEPTQLFSEMFYKRLEEHYPDAKLKYHMTERKNHSSSADPAITRALNFYFENQ